MNQEQLNQETEQEQLNPIFVHKHVIHYARIHHYNDGTYKWRRVIPIKRVYNSWVVIPLFTEKEKTENMDNYYLINELSKNENIYVDLSRQDKILEEKSNFNKYPIRYEAQKWHKLKKSTIKAIQREMNAYLYGEHSLTTEIENLTKVKKSS